jgi:hypothetical protein
MNSELTAVAPLEILVSFLPAEWRAITRGGIELAGLRYWHEDLSGFVGRGEKQLVFYDPRDITLAYVRAPDGVLRECALLTEDVARMSRTEWRRLRKLEAAAANDPTLAALKDKGIEKKEELEGKSKRDTQAARRDTAREQERSRGAAASQNVCGQRTSESAQEPAADGPIVEMEVGYLNPENEHGENYDN